MDFTDENSDTEPVGQKLRRFAKSHHGKATKKISDNVLLEAAARTANFRIDRGDCTC